MLILHPSAVDFLRCVHIRLDSVRMDSPGKRNLLADYNAMAAFCMDGGKDSMEG